MTAIIIIIYNTNIWHHSSNLEPAPDSWVNMATLLCFADHTTLKGTSEFLVVVYRPETVNQPTSKWLVCSALVCVQNKSDVNAATAVDAFQWSSSPGSSAVCTIGPLFLPSGHNNQQTSPTFCWTMFIYFPFLLIFFYILLSTCTR